jgi:hypothetical protein
MTTTERMLVAALFSILMGLTSWLLGTVTANSSRIAVLEQQVLTSVRDVVELKVEIKEHRTITETLGRAR